ncbi:hypothetical protein MWU59_12505 [Flavobacteriaceae bacterium F08102]|nr:hypothetical protein [Flavobacteriaceae bacterium F08102]
MHRNLIIKAFEKAKRDIQSTKLTHLSTHLSDYIFEVSGEQYGEKSLRTYYNLATQNSSDTIEFKEYVKQSLSKFLGYKNYQEFIRENSENEKKQNIFFLKKKTTIGLILLISVVSFFGYDMTKKNCMVWNIDHYEKVKCSEEQIMKPVKYNEDMYHHLKKIEPNCDYPFFKPDGRENLWYGKSAKGELEFFTHYGLHPITNQTLNPITQYMIDKYICTAVSIGE